MHKKKKLEFRYIILAILLLITIVLGGVFFALRDGRNTLILEGVIKDVGNMILKVLETPTNWIRDVVDKEKEKNYIYRTYKDMQEQYEFLSTLESELSEAKKELADLESLLELNATLSEKTYTNATVLSRDIGYWYNTLTIDRGSHDSIEVGQAVVTSEGLLGYISSTSMFTSTVKLLTSGDENDKVSVKLEVGDSFVYGLLTTYDNDTNMFKIEGISENTGIPKDAKVTTTGLGNQFPSGILIGTVSDVNLDHFELAKTVYVKPAVNFNNTNYVTVLKRKLDE